MGEGGRVLKRSADSYVQFKNRTRRRSHLPRALMKIVDEVRIAPPSLTAFSPLETRKLSCNVANACEMLSHSRQKTLNNIPNYLHLLIPQGTTNLNVDNQLLKYNSPESDFFFLFSLSFLLSFTFGNRASFCNSS